ncbi:MAG: DUF3619 family protein [Oleiphilaceae bacterium]|nr:DUF3619 family protein [Oleiphilaceae bacterium]
MTNNRPDRRKAEERLTEQTRRHLDPVSENLDPVIAERLAAARQQALEQMGRETPRRSRTTLAGMGLAASVALVAVLASLYNGNDTPGQALGAEDLELMAAEEPLEFYADLEFYLWLEEQSAGEESLGEDALGENTKSRRG